MLYNLTQNFRCAQVLICKDFLKHFYEFFILLLRSNGDPQTGFTSYFLPSEPHNDAFLLCQGLVNCQRPIGILLSVLSQNWNQDEVGLIGTYRSAYCGDGRKGSQEPGPGRVQGRDLVLLGVDGFRRKSS